MQKGKTIGVGRFQVSLGHNKQLHAGRCTVVSCEDNGGTHAGAVIHLCLGFDEYAHLNKATSAVIVVSTRRRSNKIVNEYKHCGAVPRALITIIWTRRGMSFSSTFSGGAAYYDERVASDYAEANFNGTKTSVDFYTSNYYLSYLSLSTNNNVGPLWRYDYDWKDYPSTSEYLALMLSGVGAFVDVGRYGQAYAIVRYGVVNGYSWLKDTQCADEMGAQAMNLDKSPCNYPHDAGISCNGPSASGETCDTGWCSDLEFSPANDEPSGCSNSTSFASKNTIISSLVFNNGTPGSVLGPFAVFASATLTVTPSFSQDTGSDVETYNLAFPTDSALTTAMNKSTWPEHTAMSSYENGSISCAAGTGASGAGTYGYGASSSRNTPSTTGPGSLSGKDTLHFQLCRLHQQLQKCRADALNICTDGINCCDIVQASQSGCWPDTWEFCSPYTSTGYTSPVFRPFAQYFEVALGADNALCERSGDDDLRSCLVFNGRVRALDTNGGSLFTFEPNAFKDPRSFDSKGPVLGVPVEFSLLFSADGSGPSTGSYLAQFCSAADPSSATGATAATYGKQRGFLALGVFWTRLNTMITVLPAGEDAVSGVYAKFCRAYFVYAVTCRFLLGLYSLAAFTCSLDAALNTWRAPFAFFQSALQWGTYTAGVWASVAAGYSASDFMPGLATSSLFKEARPAVAEVDSDGNILVTLTVPTLLLNWAPASLLLAAFPTTDQNFGVAPFSPATAFSQVFSGLAATTASAVSAAETAETAETALSPFVLVAGTTTVQYYYVNSAATSASVAAVLSQGVANPATPSSVPLPTTVDTALDASYVAVAGKLSFKIRAQAGSFTLLFYLYYIHLHGTASLESLNSGESLVLITEPVTQCVPSVLDYPTACGLVTTGVCKSTSPSYSGGGSSLVNTLFLNADSAVCKCIYPANVQPGLASEAVLEPSAMCFNAFCRSTGATTVDRDSLIAGAIQGGCSFTSAPVSSPAAGTASGTEPATVLCKKLCPAYLAVFDNEAVDASAVDISSLQDECGVDLLSPTVLFSTQVATLAVCVLVVACVPLFFGSSLLAAWAFAEKTQARLGPLQPAFYGPVLAAFVVCCAAAAYAWFDLRGTQSCANGTAVFTSGTDIYNVPASICRSNGILHSIVTKIAPSASLPEAYVLPPAFCDTSPSYCQCDSVAAYGPVKTCTGPCGCKSSACCSDNGLCTSEETASEDPFSGRSLRLLDVSARFDPLVCAVCCAAALCLVPAAVSAMCFASPNFKGKAAVACALALFLLALCAVPMGVQALDKQLYRRYNVGVGSCVQLSEYPDTLTRADGSNATYALQVVEGSSIPTYLLASAPNPASILPAPTTLAYSSTAGAFVFSGDAVTAGTFVNDSTSDIVFAGQSANISNGTVMLPPLYAKFYRTADSSVTFTICGVSSTGLSTCTASTSRLVS